MLAAALRPIRTPSKRAATHLRTAATQTQKRAGDISDAFVSLSGQHFAPLPQEYAELKSRLIRGRETEVRDSWERLLRELREEIPLIVELGPKIVPEIDFKDLDHASEAFGSELRKRGVAVVRGVVEEREALRPTAFPPDNPQVFELYWSRTQLLARAHPNLLKTHRFLMSYWHSANPAAPISTQHPISYADRLRMRLPGDAKFALGPHVDGGSVERWDERGYGLGKVYDSVWKGEWEKFDPWEASCRLPVVSDLHQGVGACTAFRMFQGWLSLSTTGPFEGTLLVNPLLAKATAYYLLRPFFSPKRGVADGGAHTADFLASDNWALDSPATSAIHGATPGHGQELSHALHPHLDLARSMVHVPTVRPGDYVAWHCDTIHAVDKVHAGRADASVLYIPACPLTEDNARYLARQRGDFVAGTPSPDFGGGVGESEHFGRVGVRDVEGAVGGEGKRAMGLGQWEGDGEGESEGQGQRLTSGEREVLLRANKVLGFYD
ncbi:hypothetical protein BDV95DRAFT_653139 [Massariosphaeria phaeospora]|uniref:DUF1479-domain-containing protein n=1 Tax=Massariosphaeria phaeospora TaxID=100035 RepID=A0A7C8LZW6_9PLEO|nr:hypothetical protein BDV95DRAFT_653139 [Massariosphaeria phaeospora]